MPRKSAYFLGSAVLVATGAAAAWLLWSPRLAAGHVAQESALHPRSSERTEAPAPQPPVEPHAYSGREPSRGIVLTGWARLPDGEPAAGFEIAARLHAGLSSRDAVLQEATLHTASDGGFAWTVGAVAGPALVSFRAQSPRHLSRPATARVIAASSPPEPVVLDLHPLDQVRPFRVATEDDQPLAGASIEVPGLMPPLVAGSDGRARLAWSSSLGRMSVRVAAPGRRSVLLALEADPSESPAEVAVRLGAGSSVADRVVAEDGTPVAGAVVRTAPRFEAEAVSDQQGAFRLDGLDASAAAHPVTVRHADFLVAERTLERGGDATVVLSRGHVVAGEVRDAAGAPLPGAIVLLVPAQHALAPLQAVSGPDGGFRFGAVPGGLLSIHASCPGLAPAKRECSVPGCGFVTIQLPAGQALGGRILDEELRPVAGARVRARERGDDDVLGVGRSGPDGAFLVSGLPATEIDLEIEAPGFLPETRPDVSPGPRNFDIVLIAAARIEGRVVDAATGEPVRRFQVTLAPSHSPGAVPAGRIPRSWRAPGRIVESADGSFSTHPAPVEPSRAHRVEVSAEGFETAVLDSVVAPLESRVARVELRLERGSAALGTIVDRTTGKPVEGAVVGLAGAFPSPDARAPAGASSSSGADGRFEIRGLPLRGVRLEARAAGYAPAVSAEFAPVEGRPFDAGALALDPAGSIEVSVRGTRADVETAILLQAGDDAGRRLREQRVASDGAARFAELAPGTYRVALRSQDPVLDGLGVLVRVAAGEPTRLVFDPAATARLSGHVLADELLPRDAAVVLSAFDRSAAEGQPAATTSASADGSYAFEALRPGAYLIEARYQSGGRTWRGSVVIELAAGEQKADLRVSPQR